MNLIVPTICILIQLVKLSIFWCAFGRVVFQKYCETMKQLGMKLLELLAISLGVDKLHYKDLFEEGCSVMRCNFYPSCQQPSLALGTGPHCDPTSLTILHQDQVGGLDVFADNTWQTVPPRPDALVVNIGDTFTVRNIRIREIQITHILLLNKIS